ncbi:MAG: PA2169 family four-helix-bundle protein [Verrucomicrobiota bacterium]
MTTNDDATLLALNELLIATRDAERGYQEAADVVALRDLVELFEGYALQRAKFAGEMEERIKTLRATPVKGGSPIGALHRGWMDLKVAADADPTHARALLEECERGEDLALKLYAATLKSQDLDQITRTMIQRHYEQVQAAHDRVRQLRDAALKV